MKLLFFDMEFANGQVKGSIYSLGYLITDENFEILTPPTDLIINPECPWNEYVEQNILAYPKETVDAAPAFPMHYDAIKALFESVDVAVGFAVSNDVKALKRDCDRYSLPLINYRWFDTERLCKNADKHSDARGLDGCVRAWCGAEPENRHRSDGDAYATMLLLQAICKDTHATPEMLMIAYPECTGEALPPKKEKPKAEKPSPHKRRRHHRPKKKKTEKPQDGIA
ncbi:MAG: 3'-5' exonuclease [Clostridia bacterium]|nr:3'-5' exonuclease [Clostridia bacterium]